MTERISHVAKNRLLQKNPHMFYRQIIALSFDGCQPLSPVDFQHLDFQQILFPFAFILNFIPSISAARLHISIRCKKISK